MESPGKNGTIYEFGEFRLIPGENLLLRNGEPVALNPKAFSVLTLLVERNGHLIDKSEILDLIWEDSFVEEGSLSKAVWFVRHALGDTSKERFIQTVPRKGYRFVFPVERVTNLSGAFRVSDIPGFDNGDAFFNGEKKSKTNGAASEASVVVQENPLAEDVDTRKRKSLLSRRAAFAVVAGIVVVTVFLGYYGFVRISSAHSPRSIIVLPVSPINAVENEQLYEIGIAESLINNLSSAEGLVVKPLAAVRDYDSPKDPIAVGREQKADYVLVSNYQVAGEKIKVTSLLYNVATGQVEKPFQSQQSNSDIFAAQDAIATEIGSRVMERLGTFARAPSKKRGTYNEQAYVAYNQGMYLLDRQNPGRDSKESSPLEFLDMAVSLDPNYARAWAGKALAHSYAALPETDRNSEHHRKAREALETALYLDPNEALAYSVLCHQRLFDDWDYSGAEEAGRHAVELDPTSPFARSEYAAVLTSRGRDAEALDQLKTAMDMQPTSFRILSYYANALFMARRYDEASEQYKRLIDLKPDRTATYSWLIRVMEVQGRDEEAFETTVKLMSLSGKGDDAIQRYTAAYQSSGYRGALLERINLEIMKVHAYVALGDKDHAFEALEDNYKKRNYYLAVFGVVDPLYDPLRGDPRWADLLQRIQTRSSREPL